MPININGHSNLQVGANKTQKNEETDIGVSKSGNGTVNADSNDSVQLSDQAQVLKSVEDRIQQMPDIDQDKVDKIRNAITNGDYNIDYDNLAAAFRRFESSL